MSAFIQTTEGTVLPLANIAKLRVSTLEPGVKAIFADRTIVATSTSSATAQKLLNLLVVHASTKSGVFFIDVDANVVVRKWSNAENETVGETVYSV